MVDKVKYLNERSRNNKTEYGGPPVLYKYRPFDKYAFDMLNNGYLYLCPAEKLDDPTECMTTVDIYRLMDLRSNNLKRECLEQIIEMLRPYSSETNFEMAKAMVCSIANRNGMVRPNLMLEIYPELQKMYPTLDLAPFVNWVVNIPEKLDDPSVKPELELLIGIALNARQKLGICSFAEKHDSPYMWENYADSSKGYCVEYDISEYSLNKEILPVIYDDNRQTDIIKQLVGNFIGQMVFGFSGGVIDADVTQFIRLFLTKNKKWAYQKEWRLLGDAAGKPDSPRIKRIYLGNNVTDENERKICEFADKRNIPIEKASFNDQDQSTVQIQKM